MMIDGKTLYVLGFLVILTGVAGIVAGALAGTPGSIFIGSGLIVSSTWMLSKMHTQNKNKE